MQQLTPNLQAMLDKFNPPQKEAVLNTYGPQLVIAGAGSGKTSVLTTRIAYLMEMGVFPERILALTFTKKAANEMKERIIKMEGEAAYRLVMGTFHSIFISFIRPYAQCIGFPTNFTILDEDDAVSCVKKCIKNIVQPNRPEEEDMTDEQLRYYKELDSKYKPKLIKSIISSLKNELVFPDAYLNDPERQAYDRRKGREFLGPIYKEYFETCHRNGVMDFDDILLYMYQLLVSYPQIRAGLESAFDFIMVDEYQDTNVVQYMILQLMTMNNKNICVVGDDSQSIYAFRGAKIDNILNFDRDYKGARIIRLEQNYRSTPNIVNAANTLIKNNTNRIEKVCFSQRAEGSYITYKECNDERHEANYIATVIESMHQTRGKKYGDFAILYRTNSQSRAIEDVLIRKRIPYTIYSGTSFFDRLEVKDQIAYFRLVINPCDDEALRRIINKPARAVGNKAFSVIESYAYTNGLPIWKVIASPALYTLGLKPRTIDGIEKFIHMILEAQELSSTKTPSEVATWLCDMCGLYDEYIQEGSDESLKRGENIKEILNAIKSYEEDIAEQNKHLEPEEQKIPTLSGYLQDIMLLSNADTEDDNDDKVALMTVHTSKGLEFGNVFVTGMEQDLFPLDIEHNPFEVEEERRLFYVAMTRAKDNLFLTRAIRRLRNGKRADTRPSMFIEELSLITRHYR